MDTIYDLAEKACAYYSEINKSNFTDSMDIIVIQHKDGSLHSTPFYVRFGKLGVLKPKDKLVTIEVNGVEITDIKMKLDESGEAFFKHNNNNDSSIPNIQDILIKINDDENGPRSKLEHTTSEPTIVKNDSKLNDYMKAANTLKDFFLKKNDLKQAVFESSSNLIPTFYLDSTSSFDINQSFSSDNVKLNDDADMKKLIEKISSIEKTKLYKIINLSSDELKLLNLKPGQNEIKYILRNSPKDIKSTKAYIFLWDSTDKIVISDIDGTITKSDLRGHVMSMIGRDWYQEGVVSLFNSIANNGYKIIYLSARPICQCELTRSLIQNLVQSKEYLPSGAVLVNPVDFLIAFQAELIDKIPEEFKINCMNQIKSLFEDKQLIESFEYSNPFYAGFGNKITDIIAYQRIGIQESCIFIVDQTGKVSGDSKGLESFSYDVINENINEFFPSIKK